MLEEVRITPYYLRFFLMEVRFLDMCRVKYQKMIEMWVKY